MESIQINSKVIWTSFIFFAIGMILLSIYLVASEVKEAKKECSSIGGVYQLTFKQGHLCDGKKFIKYNSCMVLGNKMDCNMDWVYADSIGEMNISQWLK